MTIRFDTAVTIGRHLITPRGRCDRRALLAVTVGMLAAQFLSAVVVSIAGGDVTGNAFLALNGLFLWVGAVALLKRLHDIGYSGWRVGPAILFWLVGAMVIVLALQFVVGHAAFTAALATYPALHLALAALLSLPPFGGLLWLQASAGDVGSNRFGPVPGAFGFAHGHPKRGDHAVPADALSA